MLNKRTGNLKRTALNFVDGFDFIDKGQIAETALKVTNDYEKRIADEKIDKKKLLANPKQLIQRVRNSVLWQITQGIKEKYKGEKYRWLPSEANEPDPEHQLNYGKTFIVGQGEMPGDRPGCQCGIEILVDETKLEL